MNSFNSSNGLLCKIFIKNLKIANIVTKKSEKMKQNLLKKWLVAQIKPNSYDLAIRNLDRQGFETFIPKMKSTIKKENKFINKDLLLFPGYAFIGTDLKSSSWTKINNTYGVIRVLAFNNKPSVIPLDLIIALKNRYEDNFNPIINEKLKKGDTIKFNSGPFANLAANIEKVNSEKRIYVLLEVMGGYRKLEINLKEEISFIKI